MMLVGMALELALESVTDSYTNSSTDPGGYDPAIDQLAGHCRAIRIAGQLGYGRSILSMFNNLPMIVLLRNGHWPDLSCSRT